MKIIIKTFANLKDILGFDEKAFDLPENITVNQAIDVLKSEYRNFELYEGLLLIAKNEENYTRELLQKYAIKQ